MSDYRWDGLEPVTRQSITRLEDSPNGLNCGCDRHDDRVRLCQYHVGMDDGAEAMAAENERLREELSDTTMRLGLAEADRDAHMAEVERLGGVVRAAWDRENRLAAAVQAVRDLPTVTYTIRNGADVIVVRKADLDAALGGGWCARRMEPCRPECPPCALDAVLGKGGERDE